MSSKQYLTEKVNLKLDLDLLDALRRLADLGDRSVQAEIRRTLRKHVLESNAMGPYNDPSCPPDTEAP